MSTSIGQRSFKIKWIQNISVYQTSSRLILVGSNRAENRFRLLQIDRTIQNDLHIFEDDNDYDETEINEKIGTLVLKHNNSTKVKSVATSSVIKAFGIVGFVKFLEGYYLILLTKIQHVGQISGHSLNKIEETSMIYIPNVTINNPDENRYLKLFQSVDLSSNFYFSYSYDLSNTLQHNIIKLKKSEHICKDDFEFESQNSQNKVDNSMPGLLSNTKLKKTWRGPNGKLRC